MLPSTCYYTESTLAYTLMPDLVSSELSSRSELSLPPPGLGLRPAVSHQSLAHIAQILKLTGSEAELKNAIVAMFLVKFDVHTGYSLEWFQTVDDEVYPLQNIEFKALPSGLHTKALDVIYFIHHKRIPEGDGNTKSADSVLYGVSVYNHNMGDSITTREDVKMFSMGVLIDPAVNDLLQNESALPTSLFSDHYLSSWEPANYTLAFNYVPALASLVLEHAKQETADYAQLRGFFLDHSGGKLVDGSKRRSSVAPLALQGAEPPKQEHMLCSLVALLKGLGPSIFSVWKQALLRKRLLLYSPSHSIEENSNFVYCISIISTIPKEVLPMLQQSGCAEDLLNSVKYYQPLYNIGVNDIDYLDESSRTGRGAESQREGFIASTTDEILLYKGKMYDVSVSLGGASETHSAVSSAAAARHLPKVMNSAYYTDRNPKHLLKASQRDFRKHLLLYEYFSIANAECDDLDEEESDSETLRKRWMQLTEPVTWSEFAWSGFLWWASAGEAQIVAEAMDREHLFTLNYTSLGATGSSVSPSLSNDLVDALNIVGYFQNMTIRVFAIIVGLLNNEGDFGEAANPNALYVEFNDLYEMGLDPYSNDDHRFVQELVLLYWGREVVYSRHPCSIFC